MCVDASCLWYYIDDSLLPELKDLMSQVAAKTKNSWLQVVCGPVAAGNSLTPADMQSDNILTTYYSTAPISEVSVKSR